MSLNFVASAVLSSGDGIGHNEETKIENEDLDNLRRKQENSSGVGLFDQLQKNKDEAEEAFNQKRSDLMGVRPLDDEDVQHINSYNEAKANKRKALNEEDNAEVEIFKRMKEMKQQSEVVIEEKEVKKVETRETVVEEVVKPNVIIKKKKKRVEKKEKKVEENKLVGLLGGYGSDSD